MVAHAKGAEENCLAHALIIVIVTYLPALPTRLMIHIIIINV